MKPVVKVTLRKTWHTSVQYLSCLFSFPLPITTAFMNHFYPSPTHHVIVYRRILHPSIPGVSFCTIFYPPCLLSQSLPSRYSVFSFTVRSLFSYYISFYYRHLFIHFSLLTPPHSLFCTSFSLPLVFYRLISYHLSITICSFAIACITTFLCTLCTSTIFFVLSFIRSIIAYRRSIRFQFLFYTAPFQSPFSLVLVI